ncbi:MAG: NADH:flavin oxidoreductase [Candidatus Sulfobium sp.]|jgi:2,4-dienoyl-CoA reductase-like NADH-dependent reductase (Old Yellow Enzyme family)
MSELFERSAIRGMELANRFVRSATWEGLAAGDGAVTPRLTEMMVELVRGEAGLIITSYAFVSPEGRSNPTQIGACDDGLLPGLADMARAVHAAGGKIALQLVHGGCASNPGVTGLGPLGPSEGTREGMLRCRAASGEDIARIISDFAGAAARAKQAGFDAVQLHAAHGFLLSQFLSPAFNGRTDDYGGSPENRARLLLEVVRAVREAAGPAYPVLVKINSEDFLEGGMTREESVEVSAMLEKASVDAIEISGGTVISPEKLSPVRPGRLQTPREEVFYREAAELYRKRVSVPLILVGGIRSFEVAEGLVRGGTADYISMSRPLICEPALVRRWREGDRRRSECVSDNACFTPASEGRGIYCVTMQKKRSKAGA